MARTCKKRYASVNRFQGCPPQGPPSSLSSSNYPTRNHHTFIVEIASPTIIHSPNAYPVFIPSGHSLLHNSYALLQYRHVAIRTHNPSFFRSAHTLQESAWRKVQDSSLTVRWDYLIRHLVPGSFPVGRTARTLDQQVQFPVDALRMLQSL